MTSHLSIAIAAILNDRRRYLGLNQAPLAQELGIAQSHLSDLLNGKAELDIEQAEILAVAMGLDFVKVIRDAEKDAAKPKPTDFTVSGAVNTANLAASRSKKKADEPAAD